MFSSTGSDDGSIEYTIHDLDRAPEPPEEQHFGDMSNSSSGAVPRRGSLGGAGVLRPRLWSQDSASSSHSPVPFQQQQQQLSRRRLFSDDGRGGGGSSSSGLHSPTTRLSPVSSLLRPSRRRVWSADDSQAMDRHHQRPASRPSSLTARGGGGGRGSAESQDYDDAAASAAADNSGYSVGAASISDRGGGGGDSPVGFAMPFGEDSAGRMSYIPEFSDEETSGVLQHCELGRSFGGDKDDEDNEDEVHDYGYEDADASASEAKNQNDDPKRQHRETSSTAKHRLDKVGGGGGVPARYGWSERHGEFGGDDDFEEDEGEDESDDVSDDDDEEEEENSVSHTSNSPREPVFVLGYPLPMWCSKLPTINQVAVCVVKFAPCFCCMGFKQRTDRIVLARLNVLLVLLSLFPMGSSIFLLIVMVSNSLVNRTIDVDQVGVPDTTGDDRSSGTLLSAGFWNLNATIGIAGIISALVFISAILTWRVVRYVNLVGAIRYLWALNWAVPFQAYCAVGLFDYFDVTEVWVTQYWRHPSLAWFRKTFCEPGTYNTKCTVPSHVANETYNETHYITTETEWCLINYNATDCTKIRDSAQVATISFLDSFYSFSGVWSIVIVILLLLAMDTLEHIISKPLVQRSQQSHIGLWLLLPVFACFAAAALLLLSGSATHFTSASMSYIEGLVMWIGPLYFAAGGLFFIAGLLGWYISSFSISRTSDKRKKMVVVVCFIGVMVVDFAVLATIFGNSVAFSAALPAISVDDVTRGNIACYYARNEGCSNCDAVSGKCPQWSPSDVMKVLQTQAKTSATLAAIVFVYAFGAFRFGFVMRKHIATYQIEYV